MVRQLLVLLVGMVGAMLILMGLMVQSVTAAELPALPPPIDAIDESYLLGDTAGSATIRAALESAIAAHPDAFVPGTRVVPTRAAFRSLTSVDGLPLTLRLEVHPATVLMDLAAIRAEVLDGENVIGSVALHAYFELEAPALAAARDIERGTPLTVEDLALAWVPLRGKQPGQLLTDPDAILGKGLRNRVLAGRPLDGRHLTEPVLVARGATVQVRWLKGGLSLQGTAKALQLGHAGETIALTNPDSGQRFTAVVTGLNLVEVR